MFLRGFLFFFFFLKTFKKWSDYVRCRKFRQIFPFRLFQKILSLRRGICFRHFCRFFKINSYKISLDKQTHFWTDFNKVRIVWTTEKEEWSGFLAGCIGSKWEESAKQDYCITLTTRHSTQINTSRQCMLKLTCVSTDWHISHVLHGTHRKFYFCVRCSHTLCPLTHTNIESHHALYLTS